jgi:hypothetical protein
MVDNGGVATIFCAADRPAVHLGAEAAAVDLAATPEGALESQREVVDAFFAAARNGDFDALVALLDPDIVLRSDGGETHPRSTAVVQGAAAVAGSERAACGRPFRFG